VLEPAAAPLIVAPTLDRIPAARLVGVLAALPPPWSLDFSVRVLGRLATAVKARAEALSVLSRAVDVGAVALAPVPPGLAHALELRRTIDEELR
jgi:hypothetical protein